MGWQGVGWADRAPQAVGIPLPPGAPASCPGPAPPLTSCVTFNPATAGKPAQAGLLHSGHPRLHCCEWRWAVQEASGGGSSGMLELAGLHAPLHAHPPRSRPTPTSAARGADEEGVRHGVRLVECGRHRVRDDGRLPALLLRCVLHWEEVVATQGSVVRLRAGAFLQQSNRRPVAPRGTTLRHGANFLQSHSPACPHPAPPTHLFTHPKQTTP